MNYLLHIGVMLGIYGMLALSANLLIGFGGLRDEVIPDVVTKIIRRRNLTMDNVRYEYKDGQNILTLIKRF